MSSAVPDSVAPSGAAHGAVSGAVARPARRRLLGVDLARGLALVGMVCVHVAPSPAGEPVPVWDTLPGGRASALFAVLAGVGLALAGGGRTPPSGPDLAAARRALAARAAVVAAIGLTVGGFHTPAAIILAYYGLLFLVALPVLGWGPRRLAVAAITAAVVAPVASHLLRLAAPRPPGPNVGWATLFTDPAGLGQSLLLDGYYPVLTWSAYLLLGLALGRLDLAAAATAARLAVGGAAAAGAALATGAVAVRLGGGAEALGRTTGETADAVLHRLATSSYGVSPTASWWWLGTAGRHSGTTPDLVHTAGAAVAVLGLCLLLAHGLRGAPTGRRLAAPLAAVGSMTLTLYCLHVLALGATHRLDVVGRSPVGLVIVGHLALALLVAGIVGAPRRRGPLEALAAAAARAATRRVRAEHPADS